MVMHFIMSDGTRGKMVIQFRNNADAVWAVPFVKNSCAIEERMVNGSKMVEVQLVKWCS